MTNMVEMVHAKSKMSITVPRAGVPNAEYYGWKVKKPPVKTEAKADGKSNRQ